MKNLFIVLFFLTIVCLNQERVSAESRFDSLLEPTVKKNFVVERVLKADLLVLKDGQKIRLIGLNALRAPQRKDVKRDTYGIIIEEQNPEMTLEDQALEFAQKLLEKKHIRLEFDIESKDENFYTLAYAFLEDGTFVNAEVLRQGFANLKITPPNMKYADSLREAYQEARREKRGLQGN